MLNLFSLVKCVFLPYWYSTLGWICMTGARLVSSISRSGHETCINMLLFADFCAQNQKNLQIYIFVPSGVSCAKTRCQKLGAPLSNSNQAVGDKNKGLALMWFRLDLRLHEAWVNPNWWPDLKAGPIGPLNGKIQDVDDERGVVFCWLGIRY